MNKKKCVRCSTVNEEHFTYCRYCGATLPVVDRQPHFTEAMSSEAKNDGVPKISRKEYECYIGPNGEKIASLFEMSNATGSKTSWCTPVFILGLFFGFYGISAWFFSRKIIKRGFFLLVCGIVLTIFDAVINKQTHSDLYREFLNFTEGFGASVSSLSNAIVNYIYLRFSLSSVAGTVFAFISSFSALNYYKLSAERKILHIKADYSEQPEFSINTLLLRKGGRKIVLALFALFVGLIVNILSFAVTVL